MKKWIAVILLILVVAVAGFLIYRNFSGSTPNSGALPSAETQSTETTTEVDNPSDEEAIEEFNEVLGLDLTEKDVDDITIDMETTKEDQIPYVYVIATDKQGNIYQAVVEEGKWTQYENTYAATTTLDSEATSVHDLPSIENGYWFAVTNDDGTKAIAVYDTSDNTLYYLKYQA